MYRVTGALHALLDPECASLTASKDRIILPNNLHLKFRSINCPTHKPIIERTIKSICPVLENICSVNFQIVIKVSVVELSFSEIFCFQPILRNTFLQMCLKYENYFWRRIIDILDIERSHTAKVLL